MVLTQTKRLSKYYSPLPRAGEGQGLRAAAAKLQSYSWTAAKDDEKCSWEFRCVGISALIIQYINQICQGSRIARDRVRLASGSAINSSFAGSNASFRPSRQAVAAPWQATCECLVMSALVDGCERVFTQSRKLRAWRIAETPTPS